MNSTMPLKEKLRNITYIIKVIFHVLYFTILSYIILFKYNYSAEVYFSKRFFYSDIFEGLVITLLIYLFYYIIYRRNTFLVHKLKWALVIAILFILLALNKASYHYFLKFESTYFYQDVINNIVLYIGLSTILFLSLWLLDNIPAIVNTHFFETKKALKEAEERLLRQQFNPHFLFNALNSIYSMSINNNSNTSDTILKLASIMRYLTDTSVASEVKLSNEIKFIKEYIEIEKRRFGDKANISFEIVGDTNNKQIEPLLLMTLVENAFKHGFYTNNTNSYVFIKAEIIGLHLTFTVENSIQQKQHFHENNRKGKGLDNLKKRLKISYNKKSELSLSEKNDIFLAQLKITLS